MDITQYTVTELIDPTGILTGRRYEFFLYIDVEEEDELAEEGAGGIRAIYAEADGTEKVTNAYFFKTGTMEPLDFELEEEELADVLAFCRTHTGDVDESSSLGE